MDNQGMTDRRNITIYFRDFLYTKADSYGKKPGIDRSASRIMEYALQEYLMKNGVDLSDDPLKDASE